MVKARSSADRELDAIGSILKALDGLDGEAIQRVLDYVFGRLSIAAPKRLQTVGSAGQSVIPAEVGLGRRQSIRDLKEEKKPESSNQMAALVAYYLSEIADDPERKHSINAADLEKYFKQAGFKLPKSVPSTLPNATAAGYFDSAGGGLYTLNPVGYNLVVHGLPRDHIAPAKSGRRRLKKKSKKPAR